MTLIPEVMAAEKFALHHRNKLHFRIIKTEISSNVIIFYNTTVQLFILYF